MKEFIKYGVKVLCISVLIYHVVNHILYTQVGSIIDWTICVLCILSAFGIVEVFKKEPYKESED